MLDGTLEERVVGICLLLGLAALLTFSILKAKSEMEYCNFVGVEITVRQAFWTGYSCHESFDRFVLDS